MRLYGSSWRSLNGNSRGRSFVIEIGKQWRTALVVVQPATVVSWQRRRFKQYWWKLSQKKGPGRPAVSAELRKLVRTMAAANVTWVRAPNSWRTSQTRLQTLRAHGLPFDAETTHRTVANLEDDSE